MILPPHFLGQSAKQLKVVKSTLTIPVSTIWAGFLTVIRSGILKPFLAKARAIPLCVHPFASIQRVFYAGIPDAAEDDDE